LGSTEQNALSKVGFETERKYRIISKDGTIKWVQDHLQTFHDESQKENILQGTLYEITDQILAQEKIRESEERFEKIFNLSSDMICIADINGYFRMLNPAWEKHLGYTIEELTSKPFLDFIHPDDKQATLKAITEKLEKGETVLQFENRYIHKNGSEVWMDWTSQPNVMKGFTFAIARNVTERKEADKLLIEQQDQMQSMFDGIDDVIYVSDPDTYELLYVNSAVTKVWGEDIIGKKCYQVLQNRKNPCPFCTNKEIFENPGESIIWEFQNEVNKHWYRCIDKAIKWTSNKYVRFELATDITEIKTAQQMLAKEKEITESVLDSIPGVFYQIDTAGKFVRTNRNFQDLAGLNLEEMQKISAVELFEDKEKQVIAEAMKGVFRDGYKEVEANLITTKGKIPFYFTGVLKKIEEVPYLLGVGNDITQIKLKEEELRKINKELETFNKMAVGREKRMIDLKRKINALSVELGNDAPYDLSFADDLK
jgi:PAS domain S-box-containing protein